MFWVVSVEQSADGQPTRQGVPIMGTPATGTRARTPVHEGDHAPSWWPAGWSRRRQATGVQGQSSDLARRIQDVGFSKEADHARDTTPRRLADGGRRPCGCRILAAPADRRVLRGARCGVAVRHRPASPGGRPSVRLAGSPSAPQSQGRGRRRPVDQSVPGPAPNRPTGPGGGPVNDIPQATRALARHTLDPVTGHCAGCGQACPCPTANQAAATLAAAGAWDPSTRQPAPGTVPEPHQAPDRGRRRRLTGLPWKRTNP